MDVEIFDWPSRFFVPAKSPDHWMRRYGSPEGPAPHLVDIEDLECDCEDFQRNCNGKRTLCSHIIKAQQYRNQFSNKPKSLPDLI